MKVGMVLVFHIYNNIIHLYSSSVNYTGRDDDVDNDLQYLVHVSVC